MHKKETAKEFLTLCAKGKSREAFTKYVSDNFKHHNAFFKGDKNSLMIAMEESDKEHRNEIFEIKNVLEDGNLIASHSYIRQAKNLEFAVEHILKFENEKIVEMWDVVQPFPDNMINENEMF